MAGESLEVQLARVDERLNLVLKELEASKTSREKQYSAMEQLKLSLHDIGQRMENVESKLASTEPTIKEFVNIKNKVAGAGAVGKWLWMLLGVVLGAIVTGRLSISQLFKWH